MKTDTSPSLEQLRRKFFGGGDKMADAAGGNVTIAPYDDSVQTVQIQPKSGGPTKTADIKDGKVTIVQG